MYSLTKMFGAALVVAVFAGVPCRAQLSSYVQPNAYVQPSSYVQPNSFIQPNSSARLNSYSRPDSWWWVTSGVTMQVAGSFADWATSWKQPEGNSMLAQSSGTYAGKFYRTGTLRKGLLSGGIALVSYTVAWKFPRARKFVGIFNMSMGAGFGAAALTNIAENPYYKP